MVIRESKIDGWTRQGGYPCDFYKEKLFDGNVFYAIIPGKSIYTSHNICFKCAVSRGYKW